MKKKNVLKKCLFAFGIAIVILFAILVMLKYEVEGEKTLPYKLSKILIISTVDGTKVDDNDNLWNISLSQVNDFYVYISPEKEDEKSTIKEVTFSDFSMKTTPELGTCKILRPTGEIENLYSKSEQDYLGSSITYLGDRIDDLKSLQISNNGGVAGFRLAINDLGNYVSNEDTEVSYDGSLLKKVGIDIEKVATKLSFNVSIKTNDNITYQGNVTVSTPAGDIINTGTSNIEITDFDDVIFKRVKN
jgi:hypothetical protein